MAISTNFGSQSLNTGTIFDTGNTSYDSQMMQNTAIQRTKADAMAAGINPTWYLTQGGSSTSAVSAAQAPYNKEALKVAQYDADTKRMSAIVGAVNAGANVVKTFANIAEIPAKYIDTFGKVIGNVLPW